MRSIDIQERETGKKREKVSSIPGSAESGRETELYTANGKGRERPRGVFTIGSPYLFIPSDESMIAIVRREDYNE